MWWRSSWSTWWVPGQPELYRDCVSKRSRVQGQPGISIKKNLFQNKEYGRLIAQAFNPSTLKADRWIHVSLRPTNSCPAGATVRTLPLLKTNLRTAPFHGPASTGYHCAQFLFQSYVARRKIPGGKETFYWQPRTQPLRGKHTGLQTKTQRPAMAIWARNTAPWGPHILPPVDTQDRASKGGGSSSGVPESEKTCDASLGATGQGGSSLPKSTSSSESQDQVEDRPA